MLLFCFCSPAPPASAPAELLSCSSSDGRYSLRLVRLACGREKSPTSIDRNEGPNWSWTFLLAFWFGEKLPNSVQNSFFEKYDVPCHSMVVRRPPCALLISTGARLTCWSILSFFVLSSCSNSWRTQSKKKRKNRLATKDMSSKAQM